MTRSQAFRLHLLAGLLLSFMALEFAKPALQILFTAKQDAELNLDYGFAVGHKSFAMDFRYHEIYVRRSGLKPTLYDVVYPDVPNRYRYYHPPASVLSLYWIRWIPESIARGVWGLIVFVGIFLLSLFWLLLGRSLADPAATEGKSDLRGLAFIIPTLLTLSYPAIFSFERGNTDVIILLLVSLTAWFLQRSGWAWVGFLAGAATLIKCYPAVLTASFGLLAGIALVWGLFLKNRSLLFFSIKIICGVGLSALLIAAPLRQLYWHYLTSVISTYGPIYVNKPECTYCHSLPTAYGQAGTFIFIALVLAGAAALARSILPRIKNGIRADHSAALPSFAFLAAVSVYFAQISYDYNLIVAIPVILMLVCSETPGSRRITNAGLVLFSIGIFLPRWVHTLFMTTVSFSPYLLFQTAGLVLIAVGLFKIPRQLSFGK